MNYSVNNTILILFRRTLSVLTKQTSIANNLPTSIRKVLIWRKPQNVIMMNRLKFVKDITVETFY